jgi:hypothetical protein
LKVAFPTCAQSSTFHEDAHFIWTERLFFAKVDNLQKTIERPVAMRVLKKSCKPHGRGEAGG